MCAKNADKGGVVLPLLLFKVQIAIQRWSTKNALNVGVQRMPSVNLPRRKDRGVASVLHRDLPLLFYAILLSPLGSDKGYL